MNRSLFAFAAACLLACPSISSADQIVHMDVVYAGSGSYWYSATNVRDADGPALGGSGHVICFEPHMREPNFDGDSLSYVVGQNIFEYSEAWEPGQGLVNWLFDQYYADYYSNYDGSSEGYEKTMGFQSLLWKLQADYDGTNLATLSFSTGSIQDADADTNSANALLASLQSATIDAGYRSGLYTIEFLASEPHTTQNMIYITSVPEPSSLAMGFAGLSCLALIGRRRNTRG